MGETTINIYNNISNNRNHLMELVVPDGHHTEEEAHVGVAHAEREEEVTEEEVQ